MRSSRRFLNALIALLAALSLCGCANADPTPQAPVSASPKITLTAADLQTTAQDPAAITLGQETVLNITDGGSYSLSGELNGAIVINTGDAPVHLILNNVSVNAVTGPALEVISAGYLILTLPAGTESNFRDSGKYPVNTQADGCIYSTCDLTVNGEGKLNVSSEHKASRFIDERTK